MLRCGLSDLVPGMIVGASVGHPTRPETELLRPGVVLDERIINRLGELEVDSLWVNHDATADLDIAVAPKLCDLRRTVYVKMRDQFKDLANRTISVAAVQSYRSVIADLMFELIANGKFARLTDQLTDEQGRLFAHGTNVAFLSILVGLEMPMHIKKQRARMSDDEACNMVALGLGGMFHDIGKARLNGCGNICGQRSPRPPTVPVPRPACPAVRRSMSVDGRMHGRTSRPWHLHQSAARRYCHTRLNPEEREHCEIHSDEHPDGYDRHTLDGYAMLRDSRMPASARQAVLNHHQRFDGTGWPELDQITNNRQRGPQKGDQIHIFSRIIATANVLDNLLTTKDGHKRPAVAALADLAHERFDGWFDPVVRELMVRRIPPFPVGSLVRLSDGRQAVVTAPDVNQPCRPAIRMLVAESDRQGPNQIIELATLPDIHVVECAGVHVEPYLFELPPSDLFDQNLVRRRTHRLEYSKPLELLLTLGAESKSNTPIAARSLNISPMGLGFAHTDPIPEKTKCSIMLFRVDGKRVAIPGTVVRCQRSQNKRYGIGIQFDEQINLDDFVAASEE
jgi:HD-GYP domain-containing protein (c-di-GMP phosphodiesterase class II)